MTNNDKLNITTQKVRNLHILIYLLNFQLRKIAELSGIILDNSTFSIDANSDIRRTCSISLIPKDNSFNVEYGGKLWMDKYVQIFIGIEDIEEDIISHFYI